ncbi:MAG: hypothetical protein WC517_01850 [Patescibacteria group bacterium]
MKKSRGGFTLVGVLMTVLILLAGILALFLFILKAQLGVEAGRQKALTGFIVHSQFSQLQDMPAEAIPDWLELNARRLIDQTAEADLSSCRSWSMRVTAISADSRLYRAALELDLANGQREEFVAYVSARGVSGASSPAKSVNKSDQPLPKQINKPGQLPTQPVYGSDQPIISHEILED